MEDTTTTTTSEKVNTMARKSRKNISMEQENSAESKIRNVAAYIRLSVSKGREPNDSIENQKTIIKNYESINDDLSIRKFYVDENTTGTTFERKAFAEMIDDISKGAIDCVIVKDAYVKYGLKILGSDFANIS